VKSLKLDRKRSGDTAVRDQITPMYDHRPIYNEQSWELDDAPSLTVTPASRFGYTAAASSCAPCAYSVVAAQRGECLELRWAYTTVKFRVSCVSSTSAYLETECDSTLKLVPFVALYWALTDANCAKWRAAIADFSTPRRAAIDLLQWNNAGYAAAGAPAITAFAAPVRTWQEEVVHNNLAAVVEVASSDVCIGVALYALQEFPVLGLTQGSEPAKKANMQVCEFTVRTLGCAQPDAVCAQRHDARRSDDRTAANKRARWG
jgi:hypothetical protein